MTDKHDPPAVGERPAFTWGRLVGLLGLGFALYIVISSDGIYSILIDLVTRVSEVVSTRPVWGAVLFVFLSAASAMVAFFSTGVIVPVALVTWGAGGTFVLLWLGWILGGVVAYSLSRFLGRRVVTVLISADALAYGDRISGQASFGLILLFQLGVPSEIPGYVLGVLRYPFLTYLAALALAELPYAIATVYLGDSFLERRGVLLIGIGLAVVGLSTLAFHNLHRRLKAS